MADASSMAMGAMVNAQQQQMQQMQQMNSLRNQQKLMEAQMAQENAAVARQIAQMQGGGFQGPRFQESFSSNYGSQYSNSYSNGSAGWRGNDFSQFQTPERCVVDGQRYGRPDKGRDNVLVFDFGGDGRYDSSDVQATTNMMRATSGEVDFNKDGTIDMGERMQGAALRHRYSQMDLDRDGKLSANEMHLGGGRIWTDHSRGGLISNDELSSVYSMPNPNGFGPSRHLAAVDFPNRAALVGNNWGASAGSFDPYGGSFGGNYGGSYGNYGAGSYGGCFGSYGGGSYNSYSGYGYR